MHTLHALRGHVEIHAHDGEALDTLRQGESALVPACLGAYRVTSDADDAEVVQVHVRLR
jgi:hypothetical protein